MRNHIAGFLMGYWVIGLITIPLLLTALYSVARIVLGWCRHAGRLRRDDSVIRAHADERINQLELL